MDRAGTGRRSATCPLTPLDLGIRLQGTPFHLIAPPVSPDRGVRSFPTLAHHAACVNREVGSHDDDCKREQMLGFRSRGGVEKQSDADCVNVFTWKSGDYTFTRIGLGDGPYR